MRRLLLALIVALGACPTRSAAPTATIAHPALAIAAPSGAPTLLVVLFHGYGADAASFHDIARRLSPSFPRADFLTPDGFEPSALGNGGRQWYRLDDASAAEHDRRLRQSASAVSSWLDSQLDARHLGHQQLVVMGFSQGASVAGWLAIHRSPAPAAAVLFSGEVTDDEKPVAGAVATPVLMLHGTADQRIPLAALEPGAATLHAWGAQVTKQVYPGLGHSIDARELRDATAFLQAVLVEKP